MAPAFWCLGLVALAAAGQPAANQPSWRYTLGPVPEPVADVAPITVTDARPRWERFASDGPLTAIPLEDFDGSPGRWLHNELEREMAAWPDRPAGLHLHLKSFRVLVNDEPLVRAARWKVAGDMMDDALDNADSIVGGVAGGLLGIAVYELVADGPRETVEFVERNFRRTRPPKNVGKRSPSDVSCDIRAVAVVTDAAGHRRQAEVRALVVSGPAGAADVGYRGDAILNVVRDAAAIFAKKTTDAFVPSPTSPPTPVRTADR